MRFLLGITTYNRLEYLKKCVASWNQTRNKEHHWTLVIADDGSNDGTRDYLHDLDRDGNPEIWTMSYERRGVHYQKNMLLEFAERSHIDFAFMCEDDMVFLHPGWDDLYYSVAMETGFHHLVFFDPIWNEKYREGGGYKHPVCYNGLCCQVKNKCIFGCFWTFTKKVIEEVGYFDLDKFGLCGHGHIDYSWRCARAGFNTMENVYDAMGSEGYLTIQGGENYQDSIPSEQREAMAYLEQRLADKENTLREDRIYIPWNESRFNMNGEQI